MTKIKAPEIKVAHQKQSEGSTLGFVCSSKKLESKSNQETLLIRKCGGKLEKRIELVP